MPCVALLGEFSAGKSSIVNLLLGCDMLPTAVLSSTRWPTYVRYAPDLRIEAASAGGKRERVSPDAVKTLAREDISYLDIGMPNELLRRVELLDTPGFADPFHNSERTLDVIESADICIWCTLANQAWRQSERQIWLNLPLRFRRNGILVVTHVDTLANRSERLRVRARLEREAGDLFGDIVLLSVPDATRAVQADGRIVDSDLWQESGGSALATTLGKGAIDYYQARGENIGFAEMAGALWTGIELARTGPTVSPAAIPVIATTAPGTSDIPPASAAAADLQGFLATVMETVPACLATAWIDLAARQVLQFRGPDAGQIVGTTALGEAITDLFQGANVQRIERLFKRSRGLAEDERHYFQEIVIIADDCVGIFLRHQSRGDRSLVVVSDKTVNLGMALARTRCLMESVEFLV